MAQARRHQPAERLSTVSENYNRLYTCVNLGVVFVAIDGVLQRAVKQADHIRLAAATARHLVSAIMAV